ncbi:hypothetical protein GO730_00330 [Spirosoma sp. HMF3257]|uniref:Uncharacterized protein n=1 Tax=Spirosoma telluris TaxID=2183553 RepID=A0A327NG59_9BACT|nr:hypothetical protein [Spirosoma telluris]RAI73249.1 hypothetical protein HMF3257_00315 [Spirosoma telluris]
MLAARQDPLTGISYCTKLEMKKILSGKRCNLSHAIGDLITAGLVAKGKSLNTYFINPKAFRPISIDF